MCLFLEDWVDMREENSEKYEDWKDKTLAYYSKLPVSAQPKKQAEDNAVTRKIVPSMGRRIYKEKEQSRDCSFY